MQDLLKSVKYLTFCYISEDVEFLILPKYILMLEEDRVTIRQDSATLIHF